MQVRDAVEADAAELSRLAGVPTDVMRGVVHDRTVRVLDESDDHDGDDTHAEDADRREPDGANDDPEQPTLAGFVSFDARSETVDVTQLAGESPEVCSRLLEEPQRFADCEAMAVEFVVEDSHDAAQQAAADAGFAAVGPGPRFEGEQTTRFRLEPS